MSKQEAKDVIRKFMLYFDGVPHLVEPIVPTSTWELGLCDLKFDTESNVLEVTLRRPGLLIGVKGTNYKRLSEFLNCDIKITEKTF